MILAATRINSGSGHQAVANHVLRGPDNLSINILQGVEADLEDAMSDAWAHGAQYGLRHYHLDPDEPVTTEQVFMALQVIAAEFGFAPATAMVVEHHKPRANGGYDHHWHFLVPEVDPVAGRILDGHWQRARHEKVARLLEARLGHRHTTGRWNKAVVAALREEGFVEAADSLEAAGLLQAPRPRGGYTSAQHQTLKRMGLSMPKLRAAVAQAWAEAKTTRELVSTLARNNPALELTPGTTRGAWIVEAVRGGGEAPILVGALDRLVRESRLAVAQRLRGLEGSVSVADDLMELEGIPLDPIPIDLGEKRGLRTRHRTAPADVGRFEGNSRRRATAHPDPERQPGAVTDIHCRWPTIKLPGAEMEQTRAPLPYGRRRPTMFTAAEWCMLQDCTPKRPVAPPVGPEEFLSALAGDEATQQAYLPPDDN